MTSTNNHSANNNADAFINDILREHENLQEFLTHLNMVYGTWSEKLHGLDSKLCRFEPDRKNAAFSFFSSSFLYIYP